MAPGRGPPRGPGGPGPLFALLALVLAALGLYGVVAFAVSPRTRELGIRMALGASSRALLRLVRAQYLKLAAAGLGGGLLLEYAASQVLSGLHYPSTPPTRGRMAR